MVEKSRFEFITRRKVEQVKKVGNLFFFFFRKTKLASMTHSDRSQAEFSLVVAPG